MPKLNYAGSACLCRSCGLYFLGLGGFDAHRHGPWTDRACLPPIDMLDRGFWQDPNGYWIPPGRKAEMEAA